MCGTDYDCDCDCDCDDDFDHRSMRGDRIQMQMQAQEEQERRTGFASGVSSRPLGLAATRRRSPWRWPMRRSRPPPLPMAS